MGQPDLQAFVEHGGRVAEAMRAFAGAPRPWIDLSTGINPTPWAPPADLVFDPAPLPDRDALRRLEEAAARHFGVEADCVAAVPGSEIALRLLPTLGLPGPLVVARDSYGTHREVADRVEDAAAIDSGPGTVLLAHPNNPDGRMLSAAMTERLLAGGGWLVVDEAFADAVPGASLLPTLAASERAVVLRSFGKFFGLAGVRLGFVVASVPIIARVRGLLGDWPVSAQAIAWGTAAYRDRAWIAATQGSLAATARRLDALLARHGASVNGGCPLFRLIEHPDARTWFGRLARAGILTRPFADRPDRLRFGLPAGDVAFSRLEQALADG